MQTKHYFEAEISNISNALNSVSPAAFDSLVEMAYNALITQHKIIVTGMGKNLPVCQKFSSTMNSLGLETIALDAGCALHGDMGVLKDGDLLILLSKSGETKELLRLVSALHGKNISIFLITFTKESRLGNVIDDKIIVHLAHEGDLWNVIPNNSTVVNLILLQHLSTQLTKRFGLDLKQDFLSHHPGGVIGEQYAEE